MFWQLENLLDMDHFLYSLLASMPFWLATILVSKRNIHDFGAVVSKRIGELLLAISVVVTIIFLILPLWIEF